MFTIFQEKLRTALRLDNIKPFIDKSKENPEGSWLLKLHAKKGKITGFGVESNNQMSEKK